MRNISSVSRNALIPGWNKARGLKPTKKPEDVDFDVEEFNTEPFEQPIDVSDDEKEPNPPQKNNKSKLQTSIIHTFSSKVI